MSKMLCKLDFFIVAVITNDEYRTLYIKQCL